MRDMYEDNYGLRVDSGPQGMLVSYRLYESECDGYYFRYTFGLDADNAKLFRDKLGVNTEEELKKAIEDKFGDKYREGVLQSYFEKEGIHGLRACYTNSSNIIRHVDEF